MKMHRNILAVSVIAALCWSGGVLAQSATSAASTQQKHQAKPKKKTREQQAQELQAVTVIGYRESLQKALDVKRDADSIVDAISAEDIGKFPDTNAAESLSHLPGVTVDRQFGEGERVSINGTDPALNRVLINGETIASGTWGGDPRDTSGRTFNYSLLSPEIIGLMEVYKSPQARIDEGSIGGTVIIHTRKPLDLPANTLRGSLGYEYNDRSAKGNPRGSILYSWKNADGTFGSLTALTHDNETLYRAGIEFFGYTTGASIPSTANITGSGDVSTAKVPVGINSSFFQQVRKRNGIQQAFEWRPDERNEFNLTGIYIKGKYNNFSESRYVCPGCGNLDLVTDATVNNGYITSATLAPNATKSPYAQLDTNYRLSTVTTKSLNLRHDYYGDQWTFTSQVGYTRASGGKNPEYLMKYLLQSGGYNFAYNGKSTSVNYDDGSPGNWGLAATPSNLPAGSTDSSAQQAGGIYYGVSKDEERYAQFDATRSLNWGPVSEVLMGVKYSDHFNGNRAYGNRINTTDAVLLSGFDTIHTPSGLYDGLNASGDLTDWYGVSKSAVVAYLKSLPQGPYNIDYGSSFGVREITKDAYLQFNFESGALRGNFGLRYVDTIDKSYYWLNADNNGYVPALAKQHYRKPLPSFNLVYELDSDKILRFSASKVIARPRYSQLAGATSRNDLQQPYSAGGGNPNLKPYESNNFDFSAEWYFAPNSLLSSEIFYRDISNYIVNTTVDEQLFNPQTGTTETYSVSSPVNARNAKVRGISLLYQQDLGYGFGIQTNYTYAHAQTSSDYNMPYLSKNSFNIIPYFEKGPWSARINYSWRSPYFNQIGRLNSKVYADAYKELDFTAGYKVNEWMSVNLSATNLLDSTYYWYNGVKYAPIGIYKNGRVFSVGVSFKL